MIRALAITYFCLFFATVAAAQVRSPAAPSKQFVVKTKQQVVDIYRELENQNGNKQFDVAPAPGTQIRVAVFHDEKRENDLFEVHDASDDIYYVLAGEATLMLGGTLVDPNEISSGEWRSKTASGGQKVTIRKGDLVVVPRGTPHQRTVTGKGFSMIIIKVFAETVRP
jgi:mannose-6-phosphate isomerase-like protein (cupin superfamily)